MSSSDPFFSVIIPVYNREQLIQKTLDSVFEQTFDDHEVIVVDDGSTDRSAEVVEAYPQPVQLIRQENAGPGAARNRGAKVATGKYLSFLDSDDRWFPWTLSTYKSAIDQHSDPSFLAGVLHPFSEDETVKEVGRENLNSVHYSDYLEAGAEGIYVGTGMAVIKRKVFNEVGGITPLDINAEDHDLALRLGTAPGFTNVCCPPTVAQRKHSNQLMGDVGKTGKGLNHLIDQEIAGNYPGGRKRRMERLVVICQHVRSGSLSLLQAEKWGQAVTLYQRTVQWQLRLRRWRYVLGFPFYALRERLS